MWYKRTFNRLQNYSALFLQTHFHRFSYFYFCCCCCCCCCFNKKMSSSNTSPEAASNTTTPANKSETIPQPSKLYGHDAYHIGNQFMASTNHFKGKTSISVRLYQYNPHLNKVHPTIEGLGLYSMAQFDALCKITPEMIEKLQLLRPQLEKDFENLKAKSTPASATSPSPAVVEKRKKINFFLVDILDILFLLMLCFVFL